MKNKRFLLSAISALLTAVFLLASCAPEGPATFDTQASTSALFPDEAPEAGLDSIVYGETKVPVIHIDTDDGQQIVNKTTYSRCNIRFELNDIFSEYENTYTDENGGRADIRCRGNSSFTEADMRAKNKYSYRIKLDTAADLFGLGESKHWYLIANWFDVSALRNKLAYDFSGALGLTYVQNTWVELYYNGEYRGLYLLVESIRIDEGRVETVNWKEFAEDIGKAYSAANSLSPEEELTICTALEKNLAWITTGKAEFAIDGKSVTLDLSPYFDPEEIDITSGYLIEYDDRMEGVRTKWKTAKGVPVSIDNPETLNTNGTMYKYVHELLRDFERAAFSDTFYNDKGKHYSEYLDVDSMVDFWLVWNLFNNWEFGCHSLYYYIDGGKIHFGPCWDFDFSSGNIATLREKTVGYTNWTTDRNDAWFVELLGDPYFSSLCQERWFEVRELLDDLVRSVDIYRDYMGDEAAKCFERNGHRKNWYLKDVNEGLSMTFEEDCEHLKEWFQNRIQWMNEMLAVPDPNIDDCGYTRSSKILTNLTIGGTTPEHEVIYERGVFADYVITPDTKGEVVLKISTTHTSARTAAVYLNGTTLIGEGKLTDSTSLTLRFDASLLDMSENALNVLYIPAFRSDGTLRSMTSILIRVSSVNTRAGNERVLICGDEIIVANKGESVTLPAITEVRDGFVYAGWTTGDDKVYHPGKSFELQDDTRMFIRWIRTDIFSAMLLER
ncbi:MAG: CotH kinase family protein [Clostridia bacterium]|nr:CotH kinase family protein [Clostridia bacterium]